MKEAITQRRLKEVLHYDPETGVLTNAVSRHARAKAGEVAGSHTKRGRLRIKLNYVEYLVHHLAWLYMTGEFPPQQIDHKDMDQSNNRWDNLRLATSSTNGANKRKKNTSWIPASPYKGVYRGDGGRGWSSRICCQGKRIFLGTYETEEGAHAAYCSAALKLFGEFARFE